MQMDSLRPDEVIFEGADLHEIFDWDLIEDPNHPKLVQGIHAKKGVFFERLAQSERATKWAQWQSGLLLIVMLVAAYSWRLVLTTTHSWPLESRIKTKKFNLIISPNKENIEFRQGNESLQEQPADIEGPAVESIPVIDGLSVIDESIRTQELEEAKKANAVKDKASIEVYSPKSLSYRQSVKAYIEELNRGETRSEDNTLSGESLFFSDVPLKKGTLVFDSKWKAKLESAYVAEINSEVKSGKKDVYTDVFGSDVSRSGNICATTIRNPGVGEWTYYNACIQPADKLRRFGREVYKSSLSKENPKP